MTMQRTILSFIILALTMLCTTASKSQAAEAGFSWLPNDEQSITGYKIHYGTISRNYTFVMDVGLPEVIDGRLQAKIDGLQEGQVYYFAATAHNDIDESDYSTEVEYAVPITTVSFPPVAYDLTFQLNENTAVSGQLNADNLDGTPLQFTVIAQPVHGILTVEDTTGSFTYTPTPEFYGMDEFSYTATNSAGVSNNARVTLTIHAVNDSPTAGNASITVDADSSYSGQLSGADSDGDSLTYYLVTPPTKGTTTISQNGAYTYTPNTRVAGSDSFTYKVSDGTIDSNTATINITITSSNDAPIAGNSSFSLEQGSVYNGQLIASDADGDTLNFIIAKAPEKGTLSITGNGNFTYTANADATGSDSFAFKVNDGYLESNTAIVDIIINEKPKEFAFEVGELWVTSDWQSVTFESSFINPAVVAKASTMNDEEPSTVRIRNLTSTGFDIRIQEWNYLDGVHPEETIVFMVMEQGYQQIAENVQAIAGCSNVSGLNNFHPIGFSSALPTKPVVLTSVVTDNGSNAVTLRVKDITPDGFALALQEQEKNDGFHPGETTCFIAMEEWAGTVDNLMVEVAATNNTLTHTPTPILFSQNFIEPPYILAGMQSTNGPDTAVLGINGLSGTEARMLVVEEKSRDTEINHTFEIGGYVAIVPFNPTDDSDQDGLSNEQELTFNTDPGLFDTDQDGIGDGEEYNYWLSVGMNHETDSDGDGIPNLLDSDSDNDGTDDGTEIHAGYNPADPTSRPPFKFEIGEISLDSTLVRINFSSPFVQPVIIANTTTRIGSDPNVIRISSFNSEGFNVQVQEYEYLDGNHAMETLNYIVLEKGSHVLDDGTQVEAGLFTTNATDPAVHSLVNEFAVAPVVFTSIMTSNDPAAVVGRVRNVSTKGFAYQLQEQEANDQSHALETVAYLAWSPGSGVTNGIRFQAGNTTDSVTHKTFNISFDQQVNGIPFSFAGMQTTDGIDTAKVKIVQVESTGMKILIEEETSKDSEINHTTEVVGFLTLLSE